MALILFHHVILAIAFCSMTSHATVSRSFKAKVNSTGSEVCAVNTPSAVIPMAESTMAGQCGVMCNVDPSCELFQFKEDLAHCELFNYSPSNLSSIDHCTAYTSPPGTQSGSLVTSWSGAYAAVAIAILNGQLFVSRWYDSNVPVYDAMTFQPLRHISLPGIGRVLFGLVASAIDNCLYASDIDNNCVYRVDLSVTSNISVAKWSAFENLHGLSVTSVGNVLVATGTNIKEYTPSGSLVRLISNGYSMYHAVEVNKDTWAVAVAGPMNGICTTLTNGTLIKCFTGSETGSGITQMNSPRSVAIGPRGYFLVADYYNNRILTVNPSLTEARELVLLHLNIGLTCPIALSFDESRGRLYIGEDGGQKRVLVFDGIW